MKKKKKYEVSRVFCYRTYWIVEARSEEEAISMMDDTETTPDDGREEYLGVDFSDLDDGVEEKK